MYALQKPTKYCGCLKMDKANKKAWWHFWQCSRCQSPSLNSGDTRNKILEAAFQEVHRVGFQAASLKNILKETGLTKGALYHHFPNKQALGYAIVDEVLREFVLQYWITPLKEINNPIVALKSCIIEAGKQMTAEDIELGCPLNNLSQEMSLIDEGFRIRIEGIYQEWRQAITEAIMRGKEQGIIKTEINTQQFSMVFIATLEGCIGQAKSAQDINLLLSCGRGLIDLLDILATKQ